VSLPSSTRGRRAGGLAALTLGVVTLGVPATALAAPADEPTDAGGASRPESGTADLEVLGGDSLSASLTVEPQGAHFGTGKLQPDVVFAPGSSFPDGAVLDRTGAKLRLTYTQVENADTSDPVDFPDGPPVLECTWDEADGNGNGNPCDFPEVPAHADLVQDGRASLYENSVFTLELVTAPTSGQVLLPATEIHGYTGSYDGNEPRPAVVEAPGAYRTIGLTLTHANGEAISGATFALCTEPGATCEPTAPSSMAKVSAASAPTTVSATSTAGGQLVFPGRYLPGTYQIRQTASADGSPFSTAPVSFTLVAAGSPADTSAPVLLPIALPGGSTPGGPAPVVDPPASTPAPAPGAGTDAPDAGTPDADAPAADAPAPDAADPHQLASTGAEPLPLLAVGSALVLAGGGVIVAAARRRTR
jgi:hypothetical protein